MENNLGEFLSKNSDKTSAELANAIREAKQLTNRHNNIINFQEKKSVCSTAEKLQKIIKAFHKDAELIIKIKNKTWKEK